MTSACWRLCFGLALIGLPIASLAAGGQSARSSQPSTTWTPPRAVDGHPSLEGVWENNSATPLERPPQFANKPMLTDGELADLERRAKTMFSPEAEATFGDALYLTLLANRTPARRCPSTRAR